MEAMKIQVLTWILAGIYYYVSMLQLSSILLDKSVLSLRTGSPIATVLGPIINPNNFKIEGFYCEDRFDKSELILLWQDVREVVNEGYIVNDHEALTDPKELVRLKEILDSQYSIINQQVITVDKEKVGKVSDYAVETSSMFVQKIYVSQSILKSLTGGSLSIDRSQIHEVTPKKIIINELAQKSPMIAPAAAT
jgi:sporulation protein YlmC with PRC-barrel domain